MKYSGFSIVNFRGIKKLTLNFESSPKSNISLLVGLNECGKTTIMEALSFFYENVNKEDNFTDYIEIKAHLYLEPEDIKNIKNTLEKYNLKCTDINPQTSITCRYNFENSSFIKQRYLWDSNILVRKGRSKKEIKLSPTSDAWVDTYDGICQRLPEIIYYPNFLFDFPDYIYLENSDNEGRKQRFYRKLLQDILDSLNNNLNLTTHVIDRALRNEESDKDALESVINKIGYKVSNLVFNKNTSVFTANNHSKSIIITLPRKDRDGKLYVEMKLKDSEDSYYIRERSLGFRWFFTFSLFTKFRVHRVAQTRNIIFLFDEPASNLHQTAQQKLTTAFENLTNSNVSIIFATHSHHLIKPQWLENTFIVRNEALNYQANDLNETYNSSMTDITVEKYRRFVSNHPEKVTYYQPILDVLEYRPSNIENIPNVVMLEGKNDFYALTYFQELLTNIPAKINLLPGTGSGNLDTVISLYIAWGKEFVILLDSDTAGQKEKDRYLDKFGAIVKNKIFTFGDIDPSWSNSKIEDLIDRKDKLKIIQKIEPNAKQTRKKKLYLALQENLVKKDYISLSSETEKNFIKGTSIN